MLHKCANPVCLNRFRRLNQGKLFQVENEYFAAPSSLPATPTRKVRSCRRVEYYWLCDQCCSLLTLTFEKGRGMITVPLPEAKRTPMAVHLRAVRAAEPMPVAADRGLH